jgi:transposase IS3/IS911 family protein
VVVETLPMNETELAEYARQKGLYVEQILQWRQTCMQANDDTATSKAGAVAKAMERRRVRKLEQELRRKDKALAEAAALLVLSRKLEALYPKGTDGEE